jgi:hypothetical protein
VITVGTAVKTGTTISEPEGGDRLKTYTSLRSDG